MIIPFVTGFSTKDYFTYAIKLKYEEEIEEEIFENFSLIDLSL